jgi:alpha-L-fucosidase
MKQQNWHDDVFFGLHFDLHANEKDTELGKDLTVEHLVRHLSRIRPDFVQCDCKGHPGYASYPTKVGVSSPGIVKDAVAIWRQATRQLGIPLGMHYSGVWDTAALKLHPDWGRVHPDRDAQDGWPKPAVDEQGRDKNMTCPLSAYTDTYMIPQLLEIIDAYDVDGFWVDGENWASAPCYCETCRAIFSRWLGEDATVPQTPHEPWWQEWLACSRENFVDHVRRYAAAVHQRKPACTICSNWMYTVRQPDPVNAPVDYISGDFSWIWSAAKALVEARFMDSRKLSWDLMAWAFSSHGKMQDWVFKSADALCQEAGVVLSCGGAFMIYDTPNRSGTLVDWHMEELAKVADFCRARQPFCQKTRTVPQVVLLHAPEHFYAHNEPLFNLGKATDPLEGALHVLLENHCAVDIRNTDDLFEQLDAFPLCVISEQENLQPELLDRLRRYVENGGHLLVSGAETTALFDELLGVSPVEQPQQDFYIPVDRGAVCAMGSWRTVRPVRDDTDIISPLLRSRDRGADQKDSGCCAAVMRRIGNGCIAGIFGPVFGSYAYSHYPAMRSWIGQIIGQMNTPGLIRAEGPARVHLTVRSKENRWLINLVNLGTDHPLSPTSPLVEQVPPAGPLKIRLPAARTPLRVSLMPSAQPLAWQMESGCLNVTVNQVGIHDIVVIDWP